MAHTADILPTEIRKQMQQSLGRYARKRSWLLTFQSSILILLASFFLRTSLHGQNQTEHVSLPNNTTTTRQRQVTTRLGGDLSFQHISVEQGLSQPNVYSIAQDRAGFLWVATADGLNRYDGSTFKIFRRIAGDRTSLSDNFVIKLFSDSQGTLWIGTRDGGLNRYNPIQSTFTHFKHKADNAQSLSHNFVTSFAEDTEKRLWVGTEDGLNLLNAQTGVCTRFLAGTNITALINDASGLLWIGTDKGLLLWNPRTASIVQAFRHNPLDSSTLSGNDVISLYQEADRTLWIATSAHGLNRLQAQSRIMERFEEKHSRKHGMVDNNLRVVTADGMGNIWVGTQGNGALVFDKAQGRFRAYRYEGANPRSVSGNIVFAFFQDRSGAFWVGTFGNGLNVCSDASRAFRAYLCDALNPSNITLNGVYALSEDKQGILWIGTESGLVRMNRTNGAVERFPRLGQAASPENNDNFFIYAIRQTRDGMLWIGSAKGLFKLNPATMRFTSYATAESETAPTAFPANIRTNENRIFTLHESAQGDLWLGTLGGGLRRFNPQKGIFTGHFTTYNSGLSHNTVRAIAEDSVGNLWLGTRGGGLCRFHPSESNNSKAWRVFRHDDERPKTLSYDAIFSLHCDRNHVLWIGTQGGGLCKLNTRTLDANTRGKADSVEFYTWKEEQGLANNVVYGIVEDERGALWMSTHQGLSRFMPNSTALTKFKNYDWRDGLQNNEFNAGAYTRGADGRVYFGGIQGVNEFYPDSIKENSFIPPVVITSFKRFGEEVRLERDISLLDTLCISYKDNFFSLEFSALSFVQSDKNRFKYMLEGFDTKWIQAGSRHEVRYTNLEGGDYVFRVKASNNDGVWNTEGRALRVIVTPPFWQRWWFRLGVGVMGALLIVAGYRARVRLLKLRTQTLEEQVNKRTVELRESYAQLQTANEEIQRQVELLDEQSRETELANATLQEKNLEIEKEREKTDALLLNVLPPKIAERLKAGESTIAERFENVSVLFADIVGFTELAAERSPEEVVDILNTIFSAFDIFSERYKLEKIKTIGDAYMIVGGVPNPHEHHAEAVADMALEMLQTLEILRYTMKANVRVRIGISTGPVVAGIIGQKKFSYDLWGDTVNTASRMESHGEANKIHCTAEVYALLKETFLFEERGGIEIKGKGVMPTYFLLERKK